MTEVIVRLPTGRVDAHSVRSPLAGARAVLLLRAANLAVEGTARSRARAATEEERA